MGRLRRTMRMERLESRSLLAAALGIADVVVDQATGEPQVATSIEIDNAAGIRAATVEILYDPSLLQADLASVRAGTIWEGKGVAIANLNDQDGKVTAFIFATEDMSLSSGTLLDIDFMFHDDSPADARAHLGLGSVRINEGDIPISAAPLPGHKTIDGSITRQPGTVQPQRLESDSPTPQPSVPARPDVVPPSKQPQATGPQQLTPAPQDVPRNDQTPVNVQMPLKSRRPQEQLPAIGPATASGPAPAPELHEGFLCTPWSGAVEHPVAEAADTDDSLSSLSPLVEAADDLAGLQPAVTIPIAELPISPVAMLEEPRNVLDSPVSDAPAGLEATKAKQAPEATDLTRRSPLLPKPLPLFVGSYKSGNTDTFNSAWLWLLRRRGTDGLHGSDEAQERGDHT